MEPALRICANCRVLVHPTADATSWEHVPEFALKFSRAVCSDPEPGKMPSGSEIRFGLGRHKGSSGDKLVLKGAIEGLQQPADAPVTVAVDGSYKLFVSPERVVKPMSWAYVTTAGMYGLGTSIVRGSIVGGRPLDNGSGLDPERSLQAELRAIANAVRAVGDEPPVTLLTDSRDAMNFMILWRQGHQVMPGGYNLERAGGRESTLGRLARRAQQAEDRITLRWVPGHGGHPLHEAADALAKMARAWATGRLDKNTVASDARRICLGALTRHAAAVAA